MTALLIESHECYLPFWTLSISDFRSGWHQREYDWKFARSSLPRCNLDYAGDHLTGRRPVPDLLQATPHEITSYLMASSAVCCKHVVDTAGGGQEAGELSARGSCRPRPPGFGSLQIRYSRIIVHLTAAPHFY